MIWDFEDNNMDENSTIDYEIVYVKDGKLLFKQFSYEMENEKIPFTSYLPEDAFMFYEKLTNEKCPVIVFIGESKRGSGLIRYCGADPVNDDGITVSQILSRIKQAVEGATSKQLFETCNDLASSPELRVKVEKEIQDTLPEGTTFRINECGFGEMHFPLHIAGKIITEEPEIKENVEKHYSYQEPCSDCPYPASRTCCDDINPRPIKEI